MKKKSHIIKGNGVAGKIREETARDVARLQADGRTVCVVIVTCSRHPASILYVRRQVDSFAKAGIACRTEELSPEAGEEQIIAAVRSLNRDPAVTGIVVALPLSEGVDVRRVQQNIDPAKDVEGVHPESLGRVVLGRRCCGPATAQAVMELLASIDIPFEGQHAVVVGHSEIVGKPVALFLLDRLATVTVCHIATRDLASHTRQAGILVVAVGKPGLITADMVSDGVCVIDVGINRVKNELGESVTCGDVAFDEVAERASWITPVPGGVGPVTVAVLLRNAVRLALG